jgi:hypothetical protein
MNGIPLSDGDQLSQLLKERQLSSGHLHKINFYLEQSKGSMAFFTGNFQMGCDEDAK